MEILQLASIAAVLGCLSAMLLASSRSRRRADASHNVLFSQFRHAQPLETPGEHAARWAKAQRFGAILRLALVRAAVGIVVVLGPAWAVFVVCRTAAPERYTEMTETVRVALAAAALLVAVVAWVTAVMKAPPPRRFMMRRDTYPIPPMTEADERPGYATRLNRFLEDAASIETPPGVARSRMAFFANFIPGRHLPKSAAAIREVLWRIRRRLRGGEGRLQQRPARLGGLRAPKAPLGDYFAPFD